MHVGYTAQFQNPFDALSDQEVYANEIRLCDLAVELGFESLWSVEHHFDDYTMCPDIVQLLTYFAGKHPNVLLGSGVIVLPWHDPIRVAEQIALLDNLSNGRMILGLGRGLARIEYEGFRVDMNTSRERLVEYARLVLEALDKGYMEYDNQFGTQPRRQIRPRPAHSFKGRAYAAAVSPESMPLMAQLGIGVLVIPQKPWDAVVADMAEYNRVYLEVNGVEGPPPLSGGNVFCDESADRAEEMAYKWIGANYESVMRHYEFMAKPHDGVKGYEFYTQISRYIDRHGLEGAVADYVKLMPWGTPEQILAKFETMREKINCAGVMPAFSYGGMPYDDAERSLRLFAEKCLPEMQSWQTASLQVPGAEALAG
ncbi:MAG: LLM class flavin-dependent oxidoreductase [Acidimicrobiales bacterium]